MRFSHLLPIVLLTFLLTATESKRCRKPPRVVTINPPTLYDPTPFGFAHITVDTFNRVATVAGQVALDKSGNVIGTTLAEQLIETEKALNFILQALDADVEDILKQNGYVVNFEPATDLAIYRETGIRLGSPPATLISVPSLAIEGLLVEIEMSVVVTRKFVKSLGCTTRRMH